MRSPDLNILLVLIDLEETGGKTTRLDTVKVSYGVNPNCIVDVILF